VSDKIHSAKNTTLGKAFDSGSGGRQLKPKYVSYADFVPTIASEVSVYMVLDEATSRDRFISHLI